MKEEFYKDPGEKKCVRCDCLLEKRKAKFSYMKQAFPVELPTCPKCGFIFVPEELATGKVFQVEKALEDKQKMGVIK